MIEILNVKKHYGKIEALKGVSFSISEGTCFGLIGPNGAGKSTMMKILSGILQDYEGDVHLFNQNAKSDSKEIKSKMGYVPQDIVLNETLSAKDNLSFFGSLYGLKGAALKERVEEVLKLVGLNDRGNDAIQKFSGGMKRRINIGCALLHLPKFLIMDEPTVGVDPHSRNYIFEIIHSLKKEGVTVLYSSHYMEEIENLCDYIALIDNGMVIEQGTVSDILSKYATPSLYVEATSVEESVLESYGNVLRKDGGYLIETKQPLSTLHSLSKKLQQNRNDVHRLEISKPNLEDVFLQLTGKSLRDA